MLMAKDTPEDFIRHVENYLQGNDDDFDQLEKLLRTSVDARRYFIRPLQLAI
jgi:hypothetical protein